MLREGLGNSPQDMNYLIRNSRETWHSSHAIANATSLGTLKLWLFNCLMLPNAAINRHVLQPAKLLLSDNNSLQALSRPIGPTGCDHVSHGGYEVTPWTGVAQRSLVARAANCAKQEWYICLEITHMCFHFTPKMTSTPPQLSTHLFPSWLKIWLTSQ